MLYDYCDQIPGPYSFVSPPWFYPLIFGMIYLTDALTYRVFFEVVDDIPD